MKRGKEWRVGQKGVETIGGKVRDGGTLGEKVKGIYLLLYFIN